jgi:predicted hotdog family 3-hydroxylacyl-ACP dehydratase
MLNHDQIRRLIPHGGAMCLLERVLDWDADAITCAARSHGEIGNPLCHDGRIGAVCGIEYGLQAMAVHGALTANARQPVGYLVRLGDVMLPVDFLDELGAELVVRAELVQSLAHGYSYAFALSGNPSPGSASPGSGTAAPTIRGRATIALVG